MRLYLGLGRDTRVPRGPGHIAGKCLKFGGKLSCTGLPVNRTFAEGRLNMLRTFGSLYKGPFRP